MSKPKKPLTGKYEKYRLRCILEKKNCTIQEAQAIIKKQNALKITEQTTRKPGAWERAKVTTFSKEDKEVRTIVSGGGGPGTGRRS